MTDSETLHEFVNLLAGWRGYLASNANQDWPGHEVFVNAVRSCVTQLEKTITRARELEADDGDPAGESSLSLLEQIRGHFYTGPWHCMGCGADYYGDSSAHKCPVPVKRLTGDVGVFGRDWTYE